MLRNLRCRPSVRWDDAALKHRFRLGLCDRILDALAEKDHQPPDSFRYDGSGTHH